MDHKYFILSMRCLKFAVLTASMLSGCNQASSPSGNSEPARTIPSYSPLPTVTPSPSTSTEGLSESRTTFTCAIEEDNTHTIEGSKGYKVALTFDGDPIRRSDLRITADGTVLDSSSVTFTAPDTKKDELIIVEVASRFNTAKCVRVIGTIAKPTCLLYANPLVFGHSFSPVKIYAMFFGSPTKMTLKYRSKTTNLSSYYIKSEPTRILEDKPEDTTTYEIEMLDKDLEKYTCNLTVERDFSLVPSPSPTPTP